MNRQETKMVLEILRNLYPSEFKNKDADDMATMVNIWAELLSDDDPNLIANSVKAIALNDTSPFMPTVGIIRNKAYELTHQNEMSEQEAWNRVKKAICNSGYNSKKEYEALPDELKQLTSPSQLREWSQMNVDTLDSVVASNFMRSYKARKESSKKQEMLPNNMKIQIEGIKKSMMLENKDE